MGASAHNGRVSGDEFVSWHLDSLSMCLFFYPSSSTISPRSLSLLVFAFHFQFVVELFFDE